MPEAERTNEAYSIASTRPLASLVFVLPLVVAYEIGSLTQLREGEAISAERLLNSLFEIFGVFALALPAILLVTVLLIWHMLEKRPWTVRPVVIGGMALESALWTLPLLVLAWGVSAIGAEHVEAVAALISDLPWTSRLTIAIGAGIYEELLFRMIGTAVVHAIVVDLLGAKEKWGRIGAVIVTAVAFGWYHAPATVLQFSFYALAGVIFGALYLTRGFGITVGTHAFYDVLVLVVFRV